VLAGIGVAVFLLLLSPRRSLLADLTTAWPLAFPLVLAVWARVAESQRVGLVLLLGIALNVSNITLAVLHTQLLT
jgi:hypothetical protein